MSLRPNGERIVPVDDFHQPEFESWQGFLKNGEIEMLELPPGVTRVLIFDLSQHAYSLFSVEKERIWLAPATSTLILELEPRPILVLKLRIPEHKQRKMLLHLSLVPDTDSKLATAPTFLNKRWTVCEPGPLHTQRGFESLRWWTQGLQRFPLRATQVRGHR